LVEIMPSMIEQGNALYSRFLDESTTTVVRDVEYRLWQGKLVQTCESVGIKYGSYRKIVKRLQQIDSIQILETGNRGTPTIILLLGEPTEERWTNPPLTKVAESDRVISAAEVLLQQLGGADLGKMLINFEDRLKTLEARLDRLEG
jgi:hypothetical protein